MEKNHGTAIRGAHKIVATNSTKRKVRNPSATTSGFAQSNEQKKQLIEEEDEEENQDEEEEEGNMDELIDTDEKIHYVMSNNLVQIQNEIKQAVNITTTNQLNQNQKLDKIVKLLEKMTSEPKKKSEKLKNFWKKLEINQLHLLI